MNRVSKIARRSQVEAALASFQDRLAPAIELAVEIQQIPAPTFAEAARADYVQARFAELDLQDVQRDQLNNVYGRYPGTESRPPVVISAHLDTVFPLSTDLSVARNGHVISGPGIADNSTGVAGLLLLAATLAEFDLHPPADIWFVANVGEEGLGDLCGMRVVADRFNEAAAFIVVEGGSYGQIFHQAIGVRRFCIQVTAPGGHSWAHFGQPSAIHVLGHLIAAIDQMEVPATPKTTYNVGVIEGGFSVNTVAQSASMLLDLRSEDSAVLAELVDDVAKIVEKTGKQPDVSVTLYAIGDRPAGRISRRTPLVSWAEAALRHVGCSHIEFMNGSTDANVPLSRGLPAVCVGLATSGNAHRLDEYIDTTHLPQGLGQLLLLSLAAAGY